MNDENELLEPLATEAGQEAIVRAIRDISSLEYAVRAEQAASTASAKAGEASQSAIEASDAEDKAKDWATKTDTYVEQQIITIPPAQEGEEPTTETINLYSAKYYAALVQDIYNNMSFDSVPTENSNNMVSSGTVYSALDLKADKSTTYTKTEVDTALSNVQSTLTFDNTPTANSDNPVKSSGIKTALDSKQDNLTFDSTPTANSNNPVTSGGVYTALQNVNIDIDDEITEDSDNPVTSAAIYEALQNFTPSGGGGGAGNASGVVVETLYTGNDSMLAVNDELNLSKSWKDYDVLEFVFFPKTGTLADSNPYGATRFVTTKSIQNSYSTNQNFRIGLFVNDVNNDVRMLSLRVPSETKFVVHTNGSNNQSLNIKYIYGIKFSKNLSEQMYSNVLWKTSSTTITSGTITLNDSWRNYDLIVFTCGNGWHSSKFFTKNEISSWKENNQKININDAMSVGPNWGVRSVFNIIDDTHFEFTSDEWANNNDGLYSIVGIKLAQGGYSGIVSDARMTVKSGFVDLSNGLSGNARYDYNIVFDSPMPDNNYVVMTEDVGFANNYNNTDVTICDKTNSGFTLTIYQNGNRPATSDTGVSWIAIRPNSYTREGMVEDVLFSNASGVNSGTINLSGNISDYDLIDIQCVNKLNNGQSTNMRPSNIFASSQLLENLQNGNFIGIWGAVRSGVSDTIKFKIASDSSIYFESQSCVNLAIIKVVGIKFGRYVSGVAVDTTVTQNSNAVVTSGAVYDALQNIPSGGGGSSITVDSTITQGGTNPVEGGAIYTALDNKADKSTTYTKTEVDTALASKGDVTTDTTQNITGTKTFVGSKKVAFKQSAANDKLGFTLYGNTGTERGYLEFNPANTVDGVAGLMTLGNYATSAASLTQVGFRRYSNISGASGAYNLLMPMVADARTPFSLTTTYQNFYLPLGFTNGTTTVRTAKSGVVDLSPLLASLEARIAALEGN